MAKDLMVEVRCPACHKLACKAAEGSKVQVKCIRCGLTFESTVPT